MMRITPENIESLNYDEVFVFGSNESGFHGAGAAHIALKNFGARMGLGFGPAGRTFAIPTKSWFIGYTLPVDTIKFYVDRFIEYVAEDTSDKIFYVTQIGCGLAGHKPEDIAPLFEEAVDFQNIYLPQCFWDILNKDK